ncbi:MAG: PAS domain S-box protein [Anaerolineae bacterium]|nr:PAS domain S-box protein [Anaerolineae bacterium]
MKRILKYCLMARKYLLAPVFENDEEKTRAAAVLNALQLALITVVVLAFFASLLIFAEKLGSLAVVLALGIVLGIARTLMYKGNLHSASILVLAGVWVMVTTIVALAGGMNSIDAVYYLSLTVIGGLLLGAGATTVIATVSILAGLAMLLSEVWGYPLPQLFPVPAIAGWINLTLSLFLVTITLNIALRSLREALALSRQRLQDREAAEAALRESEGKYRHLFEMESDAIFLIDNEHGQILEVNAAASVLYGYRREELLAMCNIDLSVEPDQTRKATALEHPSLIPIRYHRKKDGTVFPVEITGSFFTWHGREVHIAAIRDITERQRAARELEEANVILEAAFDQIPVPITLTSAPDRMIRIVNPACREFLGIEDEPDYVGRYLSDLQRTWQDLDSDGNPVPVGELPLVLALRGITTHNKEYAVRTKNDDVRWELVSGAPIYNKAGEIIAALVTFPDITERKLAEQERERLLLRIREQARQVRQIIDTVPEGIVLLDAHQHVILANPLGESLLALLSGVKIGETLTHLGDLSLPSLFLLSADAAWQELTVNDDFGHPRHFHVLVCSMDVGTVESLERAGPGWLLVLRDVTQQREIEYRVQQQERLAAIGQLAAGIAHDFNNIMATIVLYAQMSVRSDGVPARVQERLMIIHQQAIHATHLIQQILDFSRRAILEREPVDILPLLSEQVTILQRTLPENIEIVLSYEPNDYIIQGSLTYIQQVLMNLAFNARDAMPEGGELRFELDRIYVAGPEQSPLPEMGRGDWIKITVSDTGIGIEPGVLPHIFEPFFTTKEPGRGTGLGLAQVHGIVGMHDGQIDVKTKVGHGTTFILYFPALSPVAFEENPEDDNTDLYVGDGQVILVVEDNAAIRLALVASLEALNYQVRVAENGQQAVAILERYAHEITLVLSDVVMPEMGGLDLLNLMTKRNYKVPVVLLTGHPLTVELEQMRAEGIASLLVDWVLKPLDLETLSAVIARAIKSTDNTGRK